MSAPPTPTSTAHTRSPSFTPISPDGYRPSAEIPSPIALAPLARPVPLKLRTERPDDRADPRGTHSHAAHFGNNNNNEDKINMNNIPRPRRHLRTRSYNDAELRPSPAAMHVALAEGPVTLAPEALRSVSNININKRAFSPSDSFGSAVTPPPAYALPNTRSVASSSASEWSAEDEASARAHVISTVASATGTDAGSMEVLSSRSASPASAVNAVSDRMNSSNRHRSVGAGWARNSTTRALSSLNGAGSILRKSASKHTSTTPQSQLQLQLQHSASSRTGFKSPIANRKPDEWKSHPNLNIIGVNNHTNSNSFGNYSPTPNASHINNSSRCTCSANQRSGTWTAIHRDQKSWATSTHSNTLNTLRTCDACRSDSGGRTAFRTTTTATAPNPYRNSHHSPPHNLTDNKNIFRFLKKRLGWKSRK